MFDDNTLQAGSSPFPSRPSGSRDLPRSAPAGAKLPGRDLEHAERLSSSEKRRLKRKPVGKTITYSIIADDGAIEESGLKASVVDISEDGVGILTDYPLEPGRILWFNDEVVRNVGIVRWRIDFILQNRCRVGVQFI